MNILNNDCVALEVKYHKRCYERYTSCVRHAGLEEEEKYESCKYMKSFESFCEYVKQEVVGGHYIVYVSRLKDEFLKRVRVMDKEDASNYKAFRLKKDCRIDFLSWTFTNLDENSRVRLYTHKI